MDSKPEVGILLLESTYMELPGGMGRADTYRFAARRQSVAGAQTSVVVSERFATLTDNYVTAAQELAESDVRMIGANCGFSVAFQDAVAGATGLPTMMSSLLMVPLISRIFNGRVGILTFDADSIDSDRRQAAGWPEGLDVPIRDVTWSDAWMAMRSTTRPALDYPLMRADVLKIVHELREDEGVEAIIIECTAMLPFEDDMRQASGCVVFGVTSFLHYLYAQFPALPESVSAGAGAPGGIRNDR